MSDIPILMWLGYGLLLKYERKFKEHFQPINLGFGAKNIWLCDLMENKQEIIGTGNSLCVNVKNFEIITIYAEI